MPIPFLKDSFRNHIPINWFPAKDDEKGVLLWATPGLALVKDFGLGGNIRGMHEDRGSSYTVVGSQLYQVSNISFDLLGIVSSEVVANHIGDVGTDYSPVMMESNALQLAVLSGSTLWIYNYGGSFLAASLTFTPSSLTYQDQYFIASEAGTSRFYVSGLLDGHTWDAADVASKEACSDTLVRVYSDRQRLWLFGTDTSEVWYNSGNVLFPFERLQDGVLQIGLEAQNSVARMDETVIFMSNHRQVIRMDGFRPKIVSNRKIEREFEQYSTVDDAVGFAYVWEGHWFYHINFPNANKTWVYDEATDLWHERTSIRGTRRHLSDCYANLNGTHLVGSNLDTKLYVFSKDQYSDDDSEILRILETPAIEKNGMRLFFPYLSVEWECGRTVPVGQGSDPKAMLQISDDGGNTWGNERWRSIGKIGEYRRKCTWLRNGSARKRVFKISVSDPSIATMTDFDVQASTGMTQ